MIAGPWKYIIAGAVVFAMLFGAYWVVDGRGYDRAAAKYQAEIATLRAEYAAASLAERKRQDAANAAAKAAEAERLAELQRENDALELKIKENAGAANQDIDRDRIGVGRDGVQRINKIR